MAVFDGNAIGRLSPGIEVEVRTRYQGQWASGFEVDAVHSDRTGRSDRYVVRRRSDGAVLPVAFKAGEVRASSCGQRPRAPARCA
jgi:hypothetical protein